MKLFATLFGGKTVNAPIVFGDIIDHDLSSDFTATGTQLDRGVFFKGDTDGGYLCVTVAQFLEHGTVAAAITASATVTLYLAGNQWSDTPVVYLAAAGAPTVNVNLGLY